MNMNVRSLMYIRNQFHLYKMKETNVHQVFFAAFDSCI